MHPGCCYQSPFPFNHIASCSPSPKPAVQLIKRVITSGVATNNELFNGLENTRDSYIENLGFKPTAVTVNTIIQGYCTRGNIEVAHKKLEDHSLIPTANALIVGYYNTGEIKTALTYREEMLRKGILPTVSTHNLFIHALLIECRVDRAELNAIKKVFKNTNDTKMNSTKPMIGHCFGAAGGLKAITTGWLYSTINQFNPEPSVEFDTVTNQKQQHEINVGISNPYKSLIAQVHNGSGKTTYFVLRMLSQIDPKIDAPQALCCYPT